jgi:large subunit ribosomal protein L21
MYAIIQTGNVQFRVEEGDVLRIPRVQSAAGEKLTFDKVLLIGEGGETRIGAPYVGGANVTAEVLGEVLGKKVEIFKMRRRATHRLFRGHRQHYTEVRIDKINAQGN